MECHWHASVINSPLVNGSVSVMCGNQAAIDLSKNDAFHDRTKHFRVHLHWIREKVASGEVDPIYISTHSNLADFLTNLTGRSRIGNLWREST
jgi:hypothetical protein